jgi:aspartate aminotransferase
VSPDNPTGAVHSPQELAAIGRWALDAGLWVVTDEIYEHLVYGVTSASVPVLVPELAERTVVLNGVAKTYAMTGWRVGWMIGPLDVITAATNLQSHATSNVCNVAQAAALAAVSGPLDAVEEMRVAFDRRRRLMVSMLGQAPKLVVPEPQGAFYCFPDASAYLGGRFASSAELAAGLLEEAQVAVVPGEAFGAPGCLRLSYALGDADLVRGVERIVGWLDGLL